MSKARRVFRLHRATSQHWLGLRQMRGAQAADWPYMTLSSLRMTTTIRQRTANLIRVLRLILVRRRNLMSFAVPFDLALNLPRDPAQMGFEDWARRRAFHYQI